MTTQRMVTVIVAVGALWASSAAAQTTGIASDADIRRIIAERVDTHRQAVGIVVGVIDASGRRIITYGKAAQDRAAQDRAAQDRAAQDRAAKDGAAKEGSVALDGDTVFEIGSISKVFTSLLLADAVARGEVALNDPIGKFLPATVKVPERGRAITLEDLATHTSGLPRLPSNMEPKDATNPYADYSVERLYQFLSAHQLSRDVGASYEYSNLGAGLLGHVLARRAGMDYEALVKARIAGPLGMNSTGVTLAPPMRARLAAAYDGALRPTSNWDLPTLAGAGALRSTANDMLQFLSAALGYSSSPLSGPMAAMLKAKRPAAGPGVEIALAWHLTTANGKTIVWHNGGTGGYRTYMAFDPAARTGVVVLANAGTVAGPDDIGRHLLDPKSPLLAANSPALAQPRARTEVAVSAEVFDRYVGRYQLAPAALLTISRENARFLVQLTGQPSFEIYAEGEKDFFLKVVDAQLTFETDPQGKVVAVVLHQGGVDQRAPRLEGEPVVPKEVSLDPGVLEGYVGRYDFVPGVSLTVTRQESRLFAQLTGQPSVEVFASGPRDFFYKVVNAQLTFEVGADGRATAVVLHQLGRDQRAARGN